MKRMKGKTKKSPRTNGRTGEMYLERREKGKGGGRSIFRQFISFNSLLTFKMNRHDSSFISISIFHKKGITRLKLLQYEIRGVTLTEELKNHQSLTVQN